MGIYKLVRLYWLSGLIVTGATVCIMCSGYDLVNLEHSKKTFKKSGNGCLIFILFCFHLNYCIIWIKKLKHYLK